MKNFDNRPQIKIPKFPNRVVNKTKSKIKNNRHFQREVSSFNLKIHQNLNPTPVIYRQSIEKTQKDGGWIWWYSHLFVKNILSSSPSSTYNSILLVFLRHFWFLLLCKKNHLNIGFHIWFWRRKGRILMAGWDRVQSSSRSGFTRNSSELNQSSSPQTVRLGRVQPQAPSHRTIFCNDRDANALTKFKVLF